MNPEPGTFFSPDYSTARARFLDAARRAGSELDALALDARGPGGEALAIDIAWIGARAPKRVVLHTSGLHGVEAFAGSAIQLAALAAPPARPADGAIVLAHVLNPYGMAWLRRTNESNVDLNRNFLAPGERYCGAPPLYALLDRLLNPPTPPGRDGFYLKALAMLARHGLRLLKQAVAHGQYEYPRGLFYGGAGLEQGPRLLLDWLGSRLSGASYLFALDVHTGLGQWAEESLILAPGAAGRAVSELERFLERPLIDPARRESDVYTIRGGMGTMLPRALPGTRIDSVLQEFGTYSALKVLHALREENRCHHYASAALDHPAKRALREALCPRSDGWRRRVVERGLALLHSAAAWAFTRPEQNAASRRG